ncbi:MAG: hypothetical protein MZV63_54730 [Marinilabiliales bacterium]|nr:hypothetical protein [Marinilabiliales bacterium]
MPITSTLKIIPLRVSPFPESRFLEPNALIGISGLRIGQKVEIPGEQITAAVKKLWEQGLFSDVRITCDRQGRRKRLA